MRYFAYCSAPFLFLVLPCWLLKSGSWPNVLLKAFEVTKKQKPTEGKCGEGEATRKRQEISQLLSDRSEQAHLQGLELRTGQRLRHLHQRLVSWPCSWSAMHFALHSYCIVSPFRYIFVAPTVIIKVSQPFLCVSQMIKKICISSFSLSQGSSSMLTS